MAHCARTRSLILEAYTTNTVGGLARTWDCHIQRPVTPNDPVAFKEFLQSNPLFGGLEDLSLERVIAMLVEHSFPQGAMVCTEGEHGRSMYMVGRGEVEVRRSNSRGAQVPIVRLGRGEFFGEMTLVEIQPRSATVVVTEPAVLYALSNKNLYTLYLEDQNAYIMVLQNICRQLARRLRKADSRISELLGSQGN